VLANRVRFGMIGPGGDQTMTPTTLARLAALAAAALAIAGCGQANNGCPTETPEVRQVQSCTVAPGATVTVGLNVCPTCNQNPVTCTVDLSQVASSQIIALDPLADACQPPSSCPSPSCAAKPVSCTFTAPATPDVYTLIVYDPATNTTRSGTLTVGAGPSSCSFTAAAAL
jgi:hypothetical protein